jgi:nucleoside-diphosphate-sugar epimerase
MADNTRYLDFYEGTPVLVTGGSGAIGANLCRALAGLGATVVALDDLSSSDCTALTNVPNCVLVEGGVTEQAALDHVFGFKPRVVFHLAALFANQNSVDHPERDLLVNGLGTLKVLQSARLAAADRVVYASSSSLVSAAPSQMPITEEALSIELHTPYQITKLLGELYANYFKNYYKFKTVRVRFFNSYGPGELPGPYRNVIPNFVHAAMQGKPLCITGSGEETRDWTYVGDIVDGLLRAAVFDEAVGEVFNLASGKETLVRDLALWINEITGNDAGISYSARRDWDTHSRRWASIAKAKRLLGYEPQTDLYAGLQKTVTWFSENWSDIQSRANG